MSLYDDVYIPANIRLDEDVFCLRVHKTSSRRLQDVLIKINIFVLAIRLQVVFKTSSRRLVKTSSRHLQDVSKTFWRGLQDIFKMSCPDILKTSSRLLAKTSSRHLQDVLQRCLQNVFKTCHQVKLFLLTSLQDVFNTFLRRTAKTVINRGVFRTWSNIYNGVFLWK